MAVAAPTRSTARVNDFSLKFANVNGTGSASANSLIVQSIFRMGIPVSGKNLFPSNIQGLPSWYEIRVNQDGHTSRSLSCDLMVAMDGQTYKDDVAEVKSGGYLLYDSSWAFPPELLRDDVTFLGVPLAQLCNEHFKSPRERTLMKNIGYAGALAAFLDLDMQIVRESIAKQYAGKEKLLVSNNLALDLGYNFAKENFECPLPFHALAMKANDDKIFIDGNTAAALGCLYAGATVAAWYPITPSTSVMDAFTEFCKQYRKDPETGKNNYMVIQAEDELAAIGMVIGAMWMGARAFTSTSGPGISLMNELLGLAYYTEIPVVLVDVQRVGPSTGMPTRTQQGDIMLCAHASHGDTKHICLYPGNPKEAFEFAVEAFDLAEHFQTPVILLTDLDIGMNDWVVDRLSWDDKFRPDRGRVLTDQDLQAMDRFYRYMDWDSEFVSARTLPGSAEKGAYFIRGSGHTKFGTYTEIPAQYQEVVDRIKEKIDAASNATPKPVIDVTEGGQEKAIVTLGSCDAACREAKELLAARGEKFDYMRVRGFPFAPEVKEFLERHKLCYVVEQNRDGQLRQLLMVETEYPAKQMHSVLSYGGFPLSAETVVNEIAAAGKN